MSTTLLSLLMVPLFAFGVYRRFKRNMGPQPLAPRRMIARMILLSSIGALVLSSGPTTTGLAAAASGACVGALLAAFGLLHTKFEVTATGNFYTPNKWIGLGISVLFLGRVTARMFTFYEASQRALATGAPPFSGIQRSPLTLAVVFLMIGYYVAYYAGILRQARTLESALPAVE